MKTPEQVLDEMGALRPDDLEIRLGLRSAASLKGQQFSPIRWIVPGIAPEGLTLLAGRPKLGKSWFALDIALAVAAGRFTLGDRRCEIGDVLYLALEDNDRRIQERIRKILGVDADWPVRFAYATTWPRAHENGAKHIEEWLNARPNARLIVIDVLAQFRQPQGNNRNPYELDYQCLKQLQEIASKHRIAVLVIHHVRKGKGEDDPFELVSGTMGLTGAADTTLILNRGSNGTTLYGRGRDMPEVDLAVSFSKETCRWTVLGFRSEVAVSSERADILNVLARADKPMGPSEIASATGRSDNAVRQLLIKMVEDGEVEKQGRGKYVHPSRTAAGDGPPL
jgi:hypothetical protein